MRYVRKYILTHRFCFKKIHWCKFLPVLQQLLLESIRLNKAYDTDDNLLYNTASFDDDLLYDDDLSYDDVYNNCEIDYNYIEDDTNYSIIDLK